VRAKRIFLLYPYYWPLYKAGGPVQSLFNLSGLLKHHAAIFLVSKEREIDGTKAGYRLRMNQWNDGPNEEKIFYREHITPWLLFQLLHQVKPDTVMINGIFNAATTLPGIIFSRWFGANIVISPRGMLQHWGLQRKRLIKSFYLRILKAIIPKKLEWHATDEQEKKDIIRVFGDDMGVHIASNIPRNVGHSTSIPFPSESKKIKLVFLSLINPNKNLHLIMEAVNQLSDNYTLDIFGPIIDERYWSECKKRMIDQSISYKGPIPPWEVAQTLQKYHFFVLPTQGENFGHAIFDSLACGVPVIISFNTPWNHIGIRKAGFYIDINDPNGLKKVLEDIRRLTPDEYNAFRQESLQYASSYLSTKDYISEYNFLIGANDQKKK
jgi:glycosyltransferase involved in cell wall biosynthesis